MDMKISIRIIILIILSILNINFKLSAEDKMIVPLGIEFEDCVAFLQKENDLNATDSCKNTQIITSTKNPEFIKCIRTLRKGNDSHPALSCLNKKIFEVSQVPEFIKCIESEKKSLFSTDSCLENDRYKNFKLSGDEEIRLRQGYTSSSFDKSNPQAFSRRFVKTMNAKAEKEKNVDNTKRNIPKKNVYETHKMDSSTLSEEK